MICLLIQVNQCSLQHAFASLLMGQHARLLLHAFLLITRKLHQWGHTSNDDCIFVAAAQIINSTAAPSDSSSGNITLTWGLLALTETYR